MRRRTLVAWLALLGLGPGVALAQQSTLPNGPSGRLAGSTSANIPVSSDSSGQWISLRDDSEAMSTPRPIARPIAKPTARPTAARPVSAVSSPDACLACEGGGCASCGPCGDVGCDPCCDPCGMAGVRRWNTPGLMGAWVDVDFLLWTVSGYDVPALVTAAPPGVIPAIGNAGTQVVFGNDEIDDDLRAGGRIRFGDWLDGNQTVGVEGHFFGLQNEQEHLNFAQAGDGASLGRPFFNVSNVAGLIFGPAGPGEAVLVNAFDNTPAGDGLFALEGLVDIDTSSNVYSAGGLVRALLVESAGMRADLIGGYRFFRLDEGLSIRGVSITGATADPLLPIGLTFQQTDIFDTVNEFHGGEFGVVLERDFGELVSVGLVSKIALGNVRQEVHLEGFNSITFPGLDPVNNVGGLLVQTTNAGPMANTTFTRDEFAVLPEVNLNVGMQVTRQVRATVGWSALYLSNVVRPGDQIDRSVDARLLENNPPLNPPATRPQFTFNDSDVWLYGVNFGVEATY